MEDFEYWNIDNLAKTIETQLNIEATNELLEMKTEVDKQLDFGERKTMIRYLYTIVDTSASMKSKDLKPSRMACTFELLKGFIDDFYDKNPLSHLGFGIMKETKMFQLSDLAQSSKEHYVKLQQLKESDSNEISLKNSLDVAMELLKQSPLYSSKEVLIILSANSSCDPGDISETIEELKRMKIKVSIIALSCKMFICKKITETTHGNLDLATNKERFRDILLRQATPSVLNLDSIQVTLVPIGFPARRTEEIRVMKSDGRSETTVKTRTLCSCHPGKMASQHYICPKCKGRNCDIPAKCGICSLNLISASLLARPDPVARFNLIKVLAYEELRDVGMEIEQMELEELLKMQSSCVSCCEPFANSVKNVRHVSVCPNCRFFFCLKCDVYIHDSLFNCPECI